MEDIDNPPYGADLFPYGKSFPKATGVLGQILLRQCQKKLWLKYMAENLYYDGIKNFLSEMV